MSKINSNKTLGRGFGSLIPGDLDTAKLVNQGERIQNLLITQIEPDPKQPRTEFDEQSLMELAESIKQHGVIQPIVVSPIEQEKYSIVAGERRWRAAKIAGLKRIPSIVRTAKALERLALALIENVQRVDLSPLEQAVSIERLHQQFNLTYADIAKKLGKASPTINNIVRLLKLPEQSRQALSQGRISEGHARAILSLDGQTDLQQKLLENIIESHWSVRRAEQFVVGHKSYQDTKSSSVSIRKHMAIATPGTRKLSKQLNTDIKLRRTARGGYIEIKFQNDEDLERLTKLISNT